MSRHNFKKIFALTVCSAIFLIVGCQTTTSLRTDPKKAVQVRTQMAAEYIKQNDYNAAKRELDTALEQNSRDANANMMMGVLLQREGSPVNIEKAERYFKTAIAIEPKNAQVRNNYGTYLYQLGRYNDALPQFEIAGSTLGYDQRYTAYENRGVIYVKLNDIVNAEKSFNQALHVHRDSYVSMIELAEINYFRQDLPSAMKFYQQAVNLVGEKSLNARALWVGIRLARAKSNPLEMQTLVNQLRALYPDSPEYQRYLQLQYSTEVVWK
ncbi:type IV pilus biogenesis/stability protein PilW [Acinetobacter sp. ANC 4558]|uniref:type IV pilus biogenesis/stability protein PilW n=1 Tax=Acinetobacter sp. ANC 4558 TaxID=1977876 RepID=UPI000A33F557|nr:type IV pilus biogenesis/stability protein PilW [Acinetobacter sp. ANC 4558]OTG86618.1 type IV pilus biogenesis/stability protein PilW [Acinetobacter sp. ANC 4558]